MIKIINIFNEHRMNNKKFLRDYNLINKKQTNIKENFNSIKIRILILDLKKK